MRKIFLALGLLAAQASFGQNPFITSIYTADPSARVWSDGRLYVYPSHDVDPARGCDLMDRYHVYSTDDMVNWRDEGEILRAEQVAWGRKEGGFMWAPDCVYRNGNYYFYFPHPSKTKWNDSWEFGVATSKKPASDFTSIDYIKGLGGFGMIDPCVFIDTDNTPYIYYGGASLPRGAKLKDNMMEIDGNFQDMKGLVDFHEASWVFKRNGIYYLTYADNNPKENQLRYATSKSPLGPWEYKGVFLGITGCDTNHGSVVEYKGNWYMFYHNQAISNTGHGNLRSICVDQLFFNPDGTIQLVKQTKEGVPGLNGAVKKTVFPGKRYEAESAQLSGGATVTMNDKASGKKYVGGLNAADASLTFKNVDGGKKGGRATIHIFHTNPQYGRLHLLVNGEDHLLLNAIQTKDANKFDGHIFYTVKLKPGKNNTIQLNGGKGDVNIDYVQIEKLDE